MYSERLLDHFRNPRNVGELPDPSITVDVSNPACGDMLRLTARVEHGRITQVRYKVRGCTAAIAGGSALTELLAGRDGIELQGIDSQMIESAVGGLAPESHHAAVLCVDAVKALLKKLSTR